MLCHPAGPFGASDFLTMGNIYSSTAPILRAVHGNPRELPDGVALRTSVACHRPHRSRGVPPRGCSLGMRVGVTARWLRKRPRGDTPTPPPPDVSPRRGREMPQARLIRMRDGINEP